MQKLSDLLAAPARSWAGEGRLLWGLCQRWPLAFPEASFFGSEPGMQEAEAKPRNSPRPVLGVPRPLVSLPASLDLQESSYICFT